MLAWAPLGGGLAGAEVTATPVPVSVNGYGALSGNGEWVVGRTPEGGVRWHRSGTIEELGAFEPTSVNHDGRVVVGFGAIWREGTGLSAIDGTAFAVSPNGAWASGNSFCGDAPGDGARACRWQVPGNGAPQWVGGLPSLRFSAASAIVDNGNVGLTVQLPDGRYRAARSIRAANNEDVYLEMFGVPSDHHAWLWSGSADGNRYVGHVSTPSAYLPGIGGRPARFGLWGEFDALEPLRDAARCDVRQSNADGSVLAGWCQVPGEGNTATLWFGVSRPVDLNELVRRAGDPLPGVRFTAALDVSADGRTVLASSSIGAVLLQGVPRPLACPADLTHDLRVDGVDLGLLLAAWGSVGDSDADIDGSGDVDGVDLGRLLAEWGPCGLE